MNKRRTHKSVEISLVSNFKIGDISGFEIRGVALNTENLKILVVEYMSIKHGQLKLLIIF